ncbi:SDR family NAD(P)-dependent oxidoreductase [Winogradskyella eckloniae]|uniref:SDR family NAD(P)-dependent oxidoreductase n=1 Tax=Winogradskyella eckloniae TaxID=1089306 RepID=UPI00156451E8|nr:SDR family NAD(P)-dependent oxidoreductase [Winogradskyella eckloniae]NRD18417.1 SDR family NAD(P)-dependent oxidoreductase [Winogradskyella eckloniae]
MKTQISVIGCGWLGLPLAKKLISEGYLVHGSTTSASKLNTLSDFKISPYLITLNENGISGNFEAFLTSSETIIINIPPGLRKQPNKNHVAEIKHLMLAIEHSTIKNVLYISSTSVFQNEIGCPTISADTKPNATTSSGRQLIEIENMLLENSKFNTTILRFGGLIDNQRHPSKMLSGKTNVAHPDAPINLIHKTDCVDIIHKIIEHKLWNTTLLAAYPKHISKAVYYSEYCKQHNLPLPLYNTTEKSKGKIIDSSKMVQLLNYTFKIEP